LHQFWSSFNLTAIDELSAYDTTLNLPKNYITYEVQTANLGDSVALTASLWYRSTSWADITQKADEIAEYIGYGGKVIQIEGGYIWIKLGRPFAQRMAVEDDSIRRIILNINVDYLTAT
jgi:hypothetical protein